MIDALFNFILNLFFWLVGVIGSIVIYPVQVLLVTIFPDLGDFISVVLGFFNNQLFPMVSFVKELFLDLTCCPRVLFSIFITFILARWTIAPAVRSIKLIINIWKLKSGGMTK